MTRSSMGDVIPLALQLEQQLADAGLGGYVREFAFHPTRKFRSDLAYVKAKLLVEVDGGQWKAGTGHNSGTGRERDCEKDAEAQLLGYRVFRFTTNMVQDGRAVELIRRALVKIPKLRPEHRSRSEKGKA
jgi:very-short-patch-repair endonuclease